MQATEMISSEQRLKCFGNLLSSGHLKNTTAIKRWFESSTVGKT